MKKFFKILLKTMEWCFIVFLVYILSLFFREERLPADFISSSVEAHLPSNLVFHIDSASFGFVNGLTVRGLKVRDAGGGGLEPVVSAERIAIDFFARRVTVEGAFYPRLPESYYQPGNQEKNARVEAIFPDLPPFTLTLIKPSILCCRPKKVVANVNFDPHRVEANNLHLDWPDEEEPMFLDGFTYVDIDRQEIYGEVRGSARQHHIRPMLACLDLPSALPYVDGFTEVPGKVPSFCSWKVNLINNDFDMDLEHHPTMGRYNLVPMKKADGKIHLHVYTRGTSLNYHQTFGPITGVGLKDEPLEGTVIVDGTNGYNTVDVEAKSLLPVASLLKIGGFTGDYVDDDVVGESKCRLQFRFPRAMTNNYEVMDGFGHVEVMKGQIMRMKGFKGLIELLAEKVPGVSWFTDSTQAFCDYVIEKGVIKTDNIYIEGTVFSIKMFGTFDCCKNKLDFTVRVQFTKKDSLVGKILHPLTWPFTKLLLEFKLTGTSENPKWEYISVIDRMLDAAK